MFQKNQKQILRQKMKALRRRQSSLFPDAAIHAKDIFLENFSNFSRYALYYPMGDELSTLPLVDALRLFNKTIALPQLTDKGLVFRAWHGEPLQKSDYHFLEPSSDAEIIIPEAIIIPLLAFDREGHRLGYGKGHYDRALHDLHQNHKFITVGYAYSFQEVESIFSEPHDECLDYVVSETQLHSQK